MPKRSNMPTTRLAAILFTDIVGYTAMMQANQTTAMAMVKQYETALRELIAQHSGELLQTYGDGSLSVFDSASAAVRCAKELQEQVRDQVPLRIGIHLGEITIDGEHIFGDGVNIASRIESMGVAGAVLVSSNIRQQVKNKPEFEMESLGKFSFKNVAEPMTVYALSNAGFAVPKPEEMKGKGEKLQKEKSATQSIIRMASIGFVAMTVGALLFWAVGTMNPDQAQLLPKDIREEKVAVSVFENRTGDESLDALGYLGSEWISSGLRELKVRTVSPEMVRQNKDAIGILPDNLANKPSFAEITGAAYVIAGSYFLQGDSLILNTRLSSTETGEELRNFPQLKKHKNQKEELIGAARQYLLGYWVLKRDQKLPTINPPKYEAYQAYLTCFVANFRCYKKVLEIDPDFPLARVWLMASSGIWGIDSLYYASKSRLEADWDLLTEFERNLFSYASFRYQGKVQAAFDALDANYLLDPRDYNIAHQSAYMASAELNRTDIAIERYEEMFENLPLFEDQIDNGSFHHYTDALNREGKYEQTIQFYQGLSETLKQKAGWATALDMMIALMHQGRFEEVRQIIKEHKNRKGYVIRAAYMYSYLFPDSTHNPFAADLALRRNEFEEYPINYSWSGINTNVMRFWNSRYLASYILQDWDQAEKELNKISGYDWNAYYQLMEEGSDEWRGQEQLWLAAAWACVYAHQGKREEAYAKIKELEAAGKTYNDDTHVPFLRGATSYLKARIYSVLGERDKAVEALRTSIDQGRVYIWWNITFDLDFVNLKDYPPFEELIRPKG